MFLRITQKADTCRVSLFALAERVVSRLRAVTWFVRRSCAVLPSIVSSFSVCVVISLCDAHDDSSSMVQENCSCTVITIHFITHFFVIFQFFFFFPFFFLAFFLFLRFQGRKINFTNSNTSVGWLVSRPTETPAPRCPPSSQKKGKNEKMKKKKKKKKKNNRRQNEKMKKTILQEKRKI